MRLWTRMGGNKGAEEGPVNDIDEIGLIFDIEGIKKQYA